MGILQLLGTNSSTAKQEIQMKMKINLAANHLTIWTMFRQRLTAFLDFSHLSVVWHEFPVAIFLEYQKMSIPHAKSFKPLDANPRYCG